MIIQSDNTGTDLCFDAVGGPHAVNQCMAQLGLHSIEAVGTCFEWFRAMGEAMGPGYSSLSPAALFTKGYPALPPPQAAAAREHFHMDGKHPFGLSNASDMGRLLQIFIPAPARAAQHAMKCCACCAYSSSRVVSPNTCLARPSRTKLAILGLLSPTMSDRLNRPALRPLSFASSMGITAASGQTLRMQWRA